MVLDAHIYLCATAGFFGKNSHLAEMTKNLQKWPQNRVLGLFKKVMSLVLAGINVKQVLMDY